MTGDNPVDNPQVKSPSNSGRGNIRKKEKEASEAEKFYQTGCFKEILSVKLFIFIFFCVFIFCVQRLLHDMKCFEFTADFLWQFSS